MARKRTGGGNEDRRIILDDRLIIELFNAGHTIVEISKTVGCSTHPVKKALARLGLHRPSNRRPGVGAGKLNPAWKGGRRIRTDGYVVVWTPDGERLEHQFVMEKILGRALSDGEVVHHKDGNKSNNSPDNLQLTTQSEHIREHLADMHAARHRK